MKITVLFLVTILHFHAALASEFIGAPLHSFRRQALENCWAVSGLQYIEGAIQAQTGTSYTFAQDKAFWYEIFKERLLNRWRKKAELGSGLSDDNLFTDFGFPEAVMDLVKRKKLAFYQKLENVARNPSRSLLYSKPPDQAYNEYRRLRFSAKLKESLLTATSEIEATEKIDSFLRNEGLAPGAEDFRVGRNRYSRTETMNALLSIPQIEEAADLVWVNINEHTATSSHSLAKTDSQVQVLNGAISEKTAAGLAKKMWEAKLPVIVSGGGHTWLILAKDTESHAHIVADSKLESMKRDSNPWREVSTIHVPRRILENYFQTK